MKIRTTLLVLAALVVAALPTMAQDGATNSLSFNGIGFQYSAALSENISIQTFGGDDPALEQPGGPEVAHTEFAFYNNRVTASADLPIIEDVGFMRVYRTADFAGYNLPSGELARLQALLADRPDLAMNMVVVEDNSADLPFMPTFPGAQIIRAQARYIDTPVLSGVAYLTAYRLDVSPLTAAEFEYTFQGVSNDGAYYVAAVFPVTVSLFPAETPADLNYDAFAAGWNEYLTETIATLNLAAPGDITPTVTTLDALIQSITLPGAVVEIVQPEVEVIAPTEAPTLTAPEIANQDMSLGGLAGTWRLVQYGDPAEPTLVIEGSEITATFQTSGVSGDSGCNSYNGAFVYEGNTLSISGVVSTLRACVDEAVQAQENVYLDALSRVTSYQVGDATLRLFYAEGELVFQAV